MKNILMRSGLLLALLGFAVNASAEDRVAELWNCKVEDGKTMDDVRTANSKWVKYVNANVDGGEINSYVLTPIVGKSAAFMYVDTYPSLESWTAGKALESDEMSAIEAELNEAATCSNNTLHRSEQS